jgi:hypothetical protein
MIGRRKKTVSGVLFFAMVEKIISFREGILSLVPGVKLPGKLLNEK